MAFLLTNQRQYVTHSASKIQFPCPYQRYLPPRHLYRAGLQGRCLCSALVWCPLLLLSSTSLQNKKVGRNYSKKTTSLTFAIIFCCCMSRERDTQSEREGARENAVSSRDRCSTSSERFSSMSSLIFLLQSYHRQYWLDC